MSSAYQEYRAARNQRFNRAMMMYEQSEKESQFGLSASLKSMLDLVWFKRAVESRGGGGIPTAGYLSPFTG